MMRHFAINLAVTTSFLGASLTLILISPSYGQLISTPENSTTVRTKISTPTKVSRKKKTSLSVVGKLNGSNYSNDFTEKTVAGLDLGVDLKHYLHSNFLARVQAGVIMETGTLQSVLGDNLISNGPYLQTAYVKWIPNPYFYLQSGIIDQVLVDNQLLIDEIPFPAAVEGINIGNKDFHVKLRAEQAIPTAATLSTEMNEVEPLPYLLLETFSLTWRMVPQFRIKTHITHFSFNDLPSSVAKSSAKLGNTVLIHPTNDKIFTFGSDFQGIEYGGEMGWWIAQPLRVTLSGKAIDNLEGLQDSNRGMLLGSEIFLRITPTIAVAPSFEYFYNEANTSPAFYNNGSVYGHNNREGQVIAMKLDFSKINFQIKGKYINSRLIDLNPVQSDEEAFLIQLKTSYSL